MNKDKILEDFLPDKNCVFFRSFNKSTAKEKVSLNDVIENIKRVFHFLSSCLT